MLTGRLQTLTTSSHSAAGAPVSEVRFGDEILPVMEEAAALLGDSEASQILRESYRPGETWERPSRVSMQVFRGIGE